MTHQARIEELVAVRRAAWAEMNSPCPIAGMSPERRIAVVRASASFKGAGKEITETLAAAGRSFTLRDGTVVRLNAWGDGPAILRPCVENSKRMRELDRISSNRTQGAGAVA